MARPLDFNKGDLEKRRLQKKKEKEQKKEERKSNQKKTSFEDMIAYMDENGNITSTPPDPTKKKEVKTEDIVIGSRNVQSSTGEDPVKKGRVTFFNTSKGFGFIKDSQTGEDLFVHVNSLLSPIQENDIVTFESERGPKGLNAVRVKKL
ncbi:cold-shock protein [Pseudochryseolinea flava]|uniref:Cold shock domain-containing protein n=1 Tax=Pseudochryseolinea flava TaxID=2059302 RepID=A0A364YAQ1_9BACT|nr:cold shock domain-containing protein [Pseudochryseolinea flava]RAW02928.1 cold shock domain-containing protein [Pseudochryseolinea flava]